MNLQNLRGKKLPSLTSITKLLHDLELGSSAADGKIGAPTRVYFGSGQTVLARVTRFLESVGLPASLAQTDGQRRVYVDREFGLALKAALDQIVSSTDELLQLQHSLVRQQILRLATTPLLGNKPVPFWLREFRRTTDEVALHEKSSATAPPRIVLDYADPVDLLNEFSQRREVDLILSYVHRKRPDIDGMIHRVALHRCLLIRRDHLIINKSRLPPLGAKPLDILKYLRIAVVADSQTIPAIPVDTLRKRGADVHVVGSTVEAHAHVAAGYVDAAFSFREFLSDEDEKHMLALDISDETEVQECDLVLLRGRASARDPDGQRKRLLEKLQEHFVTQMDLMRSRDTEASQLSAKLKRFQHAYHIGDFYSPGKKKPQIFWFKGGIQIQVSCPLFSNRDKPIWRVVGTHAIQANSTEFHLSGRVTGPDSNGRYHLLWRENKGDDEHAAGSCVFTAQGLENDESLAGIWIGRSSWAEGLVNPSCGIIVFSKTGNLSASELYNAAQKFQRAGMLQNAFLPPRETLEYSFSAR